MALLNICTVLASVLLLLLQRVEGGCVESGFCCEGTNNTCRAKGLREKQRNTSEITGLSGGGGGDCFCDEYCLNTGDCCKDFRAACKAVDCVLSDWDEWGECNRQCGQGESTRTRRVLVKPRNAGVPCAELLQRRICTGENCKVARASSGFAELAETGKILPAIYGSWRKAKKYDPYQDPLRSNLYREYHWKHNHAILRPTYCAHYKITRNKMACELPFAPFWARQLVEGSTVCVECQQFAMKKHLGARCSGHGLLNRQTRWDAITALGCHGTWTLTVEHKECSCNPEHEMSFIFI